MALHREEGDWRPLAEQASKEMDPQKLTISGWKAFAARWGEREVSGEMSQDLFSAIR